jgi:hypothetical protein
MYRTYDSSLRTRLLRLILPYERVRCDKCGHEAWALGGFWNDLRSGELPPGILIVFSIIALIFAFSLVR